MALTLASMIAAARADAREVAPAEAGTAVERGSDSRAPRQSVRS
jgi:hypothetical protein